MNLKKISKYYIQQRYNVLILLIYALSRYFYYLAGVRFDTTSLVWFWQFLDPELLKCRFLESIFYLHAQPPLFNILLGLVFRAMNRLASGLFL
jgi:hypothetical protein